MLIIWHREMCIVTLTLKQWLDSRTGHAIPPCLPFLTLFENAFDLEKMCSRRKNYIPIIVNWHLQCFRRPDYFKRHSIYPWSSLRSNSWNINPWWKTLCAGKCFELLCSNIWRLFSIYGIYFKTRNLLLPRDTPFQDSWHFKYCIWNPSCLTMKWNNKKYN